MNINLSLTKDYENEQLTAPAKTKPILPAVGVAGLPCLKRQLYRTNLSPIPKAVCSWIGNTQAVAMKHYAQVTEADMKEAAKMALLKTAEKEVQKTVHNPVQTTTAQNSTAKTMRVTLLPVLQRLATICKKILFKTIHV
jgi:hypothetical protein